MINHTYLRNSCNEMNDLIGSIAYHFGINHENASKQYEVALAQKEKIEAENICIGSNCKV